jgi:hypothetical protein
VINPAAFDPQSPLLHGFQEYNETMSFAPKHDWQWYDQIVSEHEIERSAELSPAERFEVYADYFETARHGS